MINWPCLKCKAIDINDAKTKCIEETDHSDCAHNVLETLCPNDDAFEEIE